MRIKPADTLVHIACGIIFPTFVFLYLLCFQSDLIAFGQDYLSQGMTSYNPFLGAIIITGVLSLLSVLSAKVLLKRFSFLPAVYYLPSALLLAILCDIHIPQSSEGHLFGSSWIVCVVIFVVLLLANVLLKNATIGYIKTDRSLLLNLTILFVILLFAVLMSNTNRVDHKRLSAHCYDSHFATTTCNALTQSVSRENCVKKLLLSTYA